MTMRIEYKKGGNTGAIADNGKGDNKEYVAVTAGGSKWFKSFKSAERWITNTMGYKRISAPN